MLIFLRPSSKNTKKIPSKESSYIFLYFGKRKPRKIPYIAGNRNSKKLLIFQEVSFGAKKITSQKSSYIFLYFGKWNILVLILRYFLSFLKRKLFYVSGKEKPRKNFLYFRNQNFLIF